MSRGLYISPTEYVSFAEPNSLTTQIATRGRAMDFQALGMFLPNPDPVLRQAGIHIKTYRDLRVDAHVGGCIRRRKASVKAMEWGIDRERSPSRVTKFVQSVFDRLDMQRIISQMLEAALYGYQPMEVMWQANGGQWTPSDIVGKPPEWFVYNTENELRFLSLNGSTYGEALPPRKFLVPRQEPTYDNPYGQADLSMVFWPTTFKKGGLKFWVQFTEKYGSPFLIGKQPRGAGPGATSELLDQLEAMIQDAVAVIPDDSSVDIKEAAGKAGSADVYERLIMMCRSEVSIALLGTNTTTEKNTTHASASSGMEVTHDIRDSDAEFVTSAINQLIDWIVDLNFGDAERPKYAMWEQQEVDKVQAERDKLLSDTGANFTNDYYMRAYQFEEGDLGPPKVKSGGDGGVLLPGASTSDTASFAEANPTNPAKYADQTALDGLIGGISNSDMQAMLAGELKPLLESLQAGADDSELLGHLAECYPQMDDAALTEKLTRLLFVAELWGSLAAAQEAQQHG